MTHNVGATSLTGDAAPCELNAYIVYDHTMTEDSFFNDQRASPQQAAAAAAASSSSSPPQQQQTPAVSVAAAVDVGNGAGVRRRPRPPQLNAQLIATSADEDRGSSTTTNGGGSARVLSPRARSTMEAIASAGADGAVGGPSIATKAPTPSWIVDAVDTNGSSTSSSSSSSSSLSSSLARGAATDAAGAAAAAADGEWNSPALQFESRFECGNLARAVRVGEAEYDLVVSPDLNTDGNTQWFYFAARGMRPGVEYRFHVVNNEKPESMLNFGMRPLYFSPAHHARDGTGWVRLGHDVCYFQNHFRKTRDDKDCACYTASWAFNGDDTGDCGFWAYCYPYPYSYLQVRGDVMCVGVGV